MILFSFGAHVDGRDLWIIGETGNTAEELRTGRFGCGFGWQPIRVMHEAPGATRDLPISDLDAHLGALDPLARDAAVEAAGVVK